MCGIVGIVSNSEAVATDLILSMTNKLVHRGPDDAGIEIYENVGLGHRRLSILDLSSAGHQPMSSLDNKLSIVFNGEIYNHLEIRDELAEKGYRFNSTSDTETILYGYQEWGSNIFEKLNGIFSIAILDKLHKQLILSRDRFGVKPLYYHLDDNRVIFASEIKSILVAYKERKINFSALHEFLYYGNSLGKNTLFKDIVKLEPGHFLVIGIEDISVSESVFWKPEKKVFVKNDISESEAIKQTAVLLERAVSRQLLSDVPVGVFLSGGIDSSAITAYASNHYEGKLNTFSAGFDFNGGHNELPLAAKIAKRYRTNHHELMVKGKDLPDIIRKLVYHHDEPFSDAANIPLYLLTQNVKESSKVIFQGDGGDELFAGYSRYHVLKNMTKYKLPILALGKINTLIPKGKLKNRVNRFSSLFSDPNKGRMYAKLLTVTRQESNPEFVLSKDVQNIISTTNPFKRYEEMHGRFEYLNDNVQEMLWIDTQIILTDTFLEKVDKSTMASGVEVRVPFLDNELAEFAMSLPSNLKVKNGVKKYLLKKALEGVVDNEVLYGQKMGFGVPFSKWIIGPLNEFFNDVISTKFIRELNVLDYKYIEYLQRPENCELLENSLMLWRVMNLCIWLEKYEVDLR